MPIHAKLVALLLVSLPAVASAAACAGIVFEDRDGDGLRREGERPLAGIAVSDGRSVLRTGADGRYGFAGVVAGPVFVIKPAGYALPARPDGLPASWHSAGTSCGDFPLRPDPRPAGTLRTLVFADPQTRDATEVGYYGRGIVDAVRSRHAAGPGAGRVADLGVTLGDVVHDDVSLYPAINRLTTGLGVPWLHVAGNHDLDFGSPTDEGSLASFRAVYGPDTFAWEEHEAAFILLDDVVYQPGREPVFIGGLREEQFVFLEQYLQALPAMRPLVIGAHIPFFDTKPGVETFRRGDRERLFALLQRFEHVLLLTGHGHVQRHHWHDADDGWRGAGPLHEYNVGAACGSFWSGVPDADGVPVSTMADGTPKGWADLEIGAHGRYALRWNVAAADIDPQAAIALHAPKVLRRGAWPGVAVYANLFMGVAEARVEYRIDDGDWLPMAKVDRPDPRLVAENLADDAADTLRAFDRLPEAAVSSHLWRGALPTTLAAGEHRIQVRAYDLWRGELTASTVYRLQDVPPR